MGEVIDVNYNSDSDPDSDGSPGKSANSATMTARCETEGKRCETEAPSIGLAAAVSTRAVAERMALQQQKRTAAAAGGEEGEEDGADAVEPPCEFDPPLGLFLARLGMIQHLPALVAEDMSLDLLRLLSEDDLHSNLGEMGIKHSACCRIILGLRKLTDDGAADASDAAKDAAVCRGRGRELEAELAAKLADLVHGTL